MFSLQEPCDNQVDHSDVYTPLKFDSPMHFICASAQRRTSDFECLLACCLHSTSNVASTGAREYGRTPLFVQLCAYNQDASDVGLRQSLTSLRGSRVSNNTDRYCLSADNRHIITYHNASCARGGTGGAKLLTFEEADCCRGHPGSLSLVRGRADCSPSASRACLYHRFPCASSRAGGMAITRCTTESSVPTSNTEKTRVPIVNSAFTCRKD